MNVEFNSPPSNESSAERRTPRNNFPKQKSYQDCELYNEIGFGCNGKDWRRRNEIKLSTTLEWKVIILAFAGWRAAKLNFKSLSGFVCSRGLRGFYFLRDATKESFRDSATFFSQYSVYALAIIKIFLSTATPSFRIIKKLSNCFSSKQSSMSHVRETFERDEITLERFSFQWGINLKSF